MHRRSRFFLVPVSVLTSLIALALIGWTADEAMGPIEAAEEVEAPVDLTGLSDAELKEKLTPMQYYVTCENGTERAFANEYWDNVAQGIYVDVISGQPLFASTTKYKSGTGWPSFYQPLDEDELVLVEEGSYGYRYFEVRSKSSDAHLGHVFNDGPEPTGLRYCMNSAALRFIPVEELEVLGLEEYLPLFEE